MSTTPVTAGVRAPESTLNGLLRTICLLLGAAGALYYIVQHARFCAVFGTSALASITVLASALVGIGLGASIAGRAHPRRSLTTITALLGVLALYAALSPWLLQVIGSADRWLLGNQVAPPDLGFAQVLIACVAGAFALAVPAGLISLTWLLVAGQMERRARSDPGPSASLAAGLAGLGAGLGALAGALVLVPTGIFAASWTAIGVILVAAGLALRAAAAGRGASAPESREPEPTAVTASGRLYVSRPARAHVASRRSAALAGARVSLRWLQAGALVAGAAALAGQFLWSRLLAHGIGTDARTAPILLAAGATSFGLGCILVRRLVSMNAAARTGLVALHIVAALATVLVYLQAGVWLAAAEPPRLPFVASIVIFALPMFVLGAVLALAAELGAADDLEHDRVGARVTAALALGGSVGVLTSWLWIWPSGGFETLVKLVALASLVTAALAIRFVVGRVRVLASLLLVALTAVTAAISPPRADVAVVGATANAADISRPEERAFVPGRTHTVLVLERGGRFGIQIDDTVIESVPVIGSAPSQDSHKWLAALPITARPEAETLLALGFGGGVTLEGVPPSIAQIDAIEPEAAIIDANRAIATERAIDPLQDPRVTVIANDQRRALRLTTQRYDVIVSQYAFPTTPSGSALVTREFLAEARVHLTDAGIFAQRFELGAVGAHALQSIAATFRSEFPYVRLYRPQRSSLIFLGSLMPIDAEIQLSRSGAPITDDVMHYSRIGINGIEDLLAVLVADETGVEALAADARVHTDAAPLPMMTADADPIGGTLDALARFDPLQQRGSWIYADLVDRVNFAYLVRRLIDLGQSARAVAVANAHPDESTRLMMVGLLHDARGQRDQAAAAYRAALDRRPDNAQARYLLLESDIGRIAQGTADDDLAALAEELPPAAAAVIEARGFAAAQAWASIAELDGALARTSVTDVWYPDVVRLRADWRSKATQNVGQLAFDALRLIDRAILIRPDRNFFLLRAAIGIAVGDGNVAVESSREIVRLVAQTLEDASNGDGLIARREVAIFRQNLNAIVMNLRGELVAGNERRAEEVRQSASLILRYLDAATEPAEP